MFPYHPPGDDDLVGIFIGRVERHLVFPETGSDQVPDHLKLFLFGLGQTGVAVYFRVKEQDIGALPESLSVINHQFRFGGMGTAVHGKHIHPLIFEGVELADGSYILSGAFIGQYNFLLAQFQFQKFRVVAGHIQVDDFPGTKGNEITHFIVVAHGETAFGLGCREKRQQKQQEEK